jgi:hypothetical protein
MTLRERAQETIYLITREWSAARLRRAARLLPADVALGAESFAIEHLPGVAQQFTEEMTATDVSVPYELYEIAKGRELAENESSNEVKTSENK